MHKQCIAYWVRGSSRWVRKIEEQKKKTTKDMVKMKRMQVTAAKQKCMHAASSDPVLFFIVHISLMILVPNRKFQKWNKLESSNVLYRNQIQLKFRNPSEDMRLTRSDPYGKCGTKKGTNSGDNTGCACAWEREKRKKNYNFQWYNGWFSNMWRYVP